MIIKVNNKKDAKIKALWYLSSMANVIIDDLNFEDSKSMELFADALDDVCDGLYRKYQKLKQSEQK